MIDAARALLGAPFIQFLIIATIAATWVVARAER